MFLETGRTPDASFLLKPTGGDLARPDTSWRSAILVIYWEKRPLCADRELTIVAAMVAPVRVTRRIEIKGAWQGGSVGAKKCPQHTYPAGSVESGMRQREVTASGNPDDVGTHLADFGSKEPISLMDASGSSSYR